MKIFYSYQQYFFICSPRVQDHVCVGPRAQPAQLSWHLLRNNRNEWLITPAGVVTIVIVIAIPI